MTAEVWNELRALAQLGEEDAEQWFGLCRACGAKIQARLRDGIDSDQVGPLLWRAAGGLAFYEYSLILTVRGEAGAFAAGDLKLSHSQQTGLRAAEEVRNARLAEAAPLLRDDQFLFCGVKANG